MTPDPVNYAAAASFPFVIPDGVLAGTPAVRVRLRPGPGTSAYAVEDAVAAVLRKARFKPRWAAIEEDGEGLADNRLLASLRSRLGMLVYIETSGRASMCDATGRLPMWDHVCLRVSLPAARVRAELFHSVVVRCPDAAAASALPEFSEYLDKIAPNGPRFVDGGSYRVALAASLRAGHGWRVLPRAEDRE